MIKPAPQGAATVRGRNSPTVWALLTAEEAAAVLNMSISYLAKARMAGDGPPFIKVGRAVRYSEAAIEEWIKKQERQSTSQQ